jgi:hypothetical protein
LGIGVSFRDLGRTVQRDGSQNWSVMLLIAFLQELMKIDEHPVESTNKRFSFTPKELKFILATTHNIMWPWLRAHVNSHRGYRGMIGITQNEVEDIATSINNKLCDHLELDINRDKWVKQD